MMPLDHRGPRVAVSVTLSPDVLDAVRRVTVAQDVSRSAVIEQALWTWLYILGNEVTD